MQIVLNVKLMLIIREKLTIEVFIMVTNIREIFGKFSPMPTEPSPSPAPEESAELVLQHSPLPTISEHTGNQPALDMTRMSGVGETKK